MAYQFTLRRGGDPLRRMHCTKLSKKSVWVSTWPCQRAGRETCRGRWGEVGGCQAQFECLPFKLILVDLLQQWLKNFLFSLPWSIPWWASACYFLMKPFSQPVVLGVVSGGAWGYFLYCILYSTFCFFRVSSATWLLLTVCTQCSPRSSLLAQQDCFHSR